MNLFGSSPPWRVVIAVARMTVAATAVVALATLTTGCVGSGKTAHTASIEPLPAGLGIVADSTTGCRDGESGFDYRFVVVEGTTDLSRTGPFPASLREHDFYHSIGLTDDLPWAVVGYQHSKVPLRAEVGLLANYLDTPVAHQGPDPSTLPADVRDHADRYLLVALRPTDFACTTPL